MVTPIYFPATVNETVTSCALIHHPELHRTSWGLNVRAEQFVTKPYTKTLWYFPSFFPDSYYFLLDLTLRYYLNFPRNSRGRHSCVIKRLLEVLRKWDCIYTCPLQRLSLDGNSPCVEPRDSYQGWQMLPGILTLQLCVTRCPITQAYIFCCLAKIRELFLRLKNYFLNSAGPWRSKHVSYRLYVHC